MMWRLKCYKMSALWEEVRPADLTKLKVPELKQLCRDRGLKVGGNKPELIARLEG